MKKQKAFRLSDDSYARLASLAEERCITQTAMLEELIQGRLPEGVTFSVFVPGQEWPDFQALAIQKGGGVRRTTLNWIRQFIKENKNG